MPPAVRNMPISLIICTRDRSASLAKTLQTLSSLDLDDVVDFELVVVDNGSSDDTRKVVADFTRAAKFKVRYSLEEKLGLSHSRNNGIRNSKGSIIMFTDDDCLVDRHLVKTAARIFSSDPFQIVGGRVELHNKNDLPLAIKTTSDRERLISSDNLIGFLHGANMAFGRSVVEKIGAFDIRLGAGTYLESAEDADFVYRAMRQGIPVFYDPDLLVYHDHGRSGSKTWYRQARSHAIGSGAMAMKHLLAGHGDLVKMAYWDFRSALRRRRANAREWRWVLAKTGLFIGAVRYLLFASWKKAR